MVRGYGKPGSGYPSIPSPSGPYTSSSQDGGPYETSYYRDYNSGGIRGILW